MNSPRSSINGSLLGLGTVLILGAAIALLAVTGAAGAGRAAAPAGSDRHSALAEVLTP